MGYAPGQPPERFEPGQAKLIRAGSDIILQVHYTTNGKPGTDRSRIGLVFAKEPPRKRVFTVSATNGKFKIPAGAPNHRVDAEFELGADVTLYGLHPHMHGRGKDFEYRVKFPGGETRTLLKVPNYRATWQLWYDLSEPIALPKGTEDRMHRALRQLAEQSAQSRSDQGCRVGRPELGRDDGRLLQCRVRCRGCR